MMLIAFKNGKLKKNCEDNNGLCRKYGNLQAQKIIQRINEFYAAENLYDISKLPQARLHKLYNDWKGHFAVDIKHPYRLILLPLNGDQLETTTEIEIVEIIDYH